ncbi:MAG: glycosyltransferase family 4 protein [Candidatus Rokubacteria bacterium]|nr:glycosyltransferase family 4 protein [Candidatus Rokubacteria bacterium]
MRICVDAQGLGTRPTGAGKALACLLRQLRQDAPGHEYLPLAPGDRTGWRLPQQLWWEQVRLPWQARRRGADLLHVAGGTSAPVARRTRLVMTLHDIAPTRHPELLPHARSRWYWGRWVPYTARFADAVLVPSLSTKRDLLALTPIPESRIHVVPLATPLDDPGPVSAAAVEDCRRRYGLTAPYLLYVGTIDRRKDHPTLLEALRRLDAPLTLALAGTLIRGRTDFPERVERLGLRDRVRVLGYVPEADLVPLYQGAAAFVYPSLYEGFGLPVLEAMACGTPVVTYDATSLPEVAGEAALLLAPPWTPEALADAIRRLLDDEALRLELRHRGLEQAKRFSWAETARGTVAVYEAVGGGGGAV